jgi:uncharacterized protein YkwD
MKRFVLVAIAALWAIAAAANPQALNALNTYRADNGRAPVSYSKTLEQVAQRHGSDMVRNGFFSHSGSNGSGLGDRLRAGGYSYCFAAENIAKGQTSLGAVMTSWANSKGHRKNMLHRKATAFGLYRAQGNIWVMVLAAPGC